MTGAAEWWDRYEQARTTPHGATQIALVEELLRRVDTAGDRRLAFLTRLLATNAYVYGGEPAKAFVTFTWAVSDFDRNPAPHRRGVGVRAGALAAGAAAHDVLATWLYATPPPGMAHAAEGARLMWDGGTVVTLSSDAAVEAYPGWGGYGSAKAALDQLAAVLGEEEPGLRVYAFDPGDMRTAMHQRAFPGEDISDRPEPETVVPALLRLLAEHPASGRYRAADLLIGGPA